jgi:hypothetical protein
MRAAVGLLSAFVAEQHKYFNAILSFCFSVFQFIKEMNRLLIVFIETQ